MIKAELVFKLLNRRPICLIPLVSEAEYTNAIYWAEELWVHTRMPAPMFHDVPERSRNTLQRKSRCIYLFLTFLKGHLLVIPLLFKGKTIQNLGQPIHSYELIPLNIFVGMSFLVFGGWIEGGWRHMSVGGVVRTYVQCTLCMCLLHDIRDVS